MIPPAPPIDTTPSPSFTITCWNANSLLARSTAVHLYLHHYRPSIFIITEPRTQRHKQKIPQHPSYTSIETQHKHEHGGFVIYIHKSITYQQQHITTCAFDTTPNTSTSSSIALFQISSHQLPRPFLLIPIYMSGHASSTDWHQFTQFIQNAPTHNTRRTMSVIVAGDLNAKDPSWHMQHADNHINTNGSYLSSFLSQHTTDDWQLLNITHQQGGLQPTHFSATLNTQPSVIDLALCNNINLITQFETHTQHELLHSDHAPITITLHTLQPRHQQPQQQQPTKQIWHTTRDNIPWDIFQSL